MKRENSRPLAIVAFVIFIDALGFGLILPVVPGLIGEIAHTNIEDAAKIGGYLLFAYASMQFVFSPIIGGLSDCLGRRPVLLVALFLLGFDYAVMAVAQTVEWLFVGRVLSGVMGATWAAANSCVADTVDSENRGAAFGLLGGASAAGFVLGPALGGLAGEVGLRLPFAIASVLAFAGALIGYFLLKETLPDQRRRRFSLRRANPFGSIFQAMQTPAVFYCLTVMFLFQLSTQAQISIWVYWGDIRFDWTPLTSGLTVSLYGILLAVTQALLAGVSIKRYGAPQTARYSLLFSIPAYLLLAFAPSTAWVVLAIAIGAISGMVFPALQTIMTEKIDGNAQGELQGSISSVISLTAIVGPVIMTQVFSHYTDASGVFFPGAPYIIAIVLSATAAAMLWKIAPKQKQS